MPDPTPDDHRPRRPDHGDDNPARPAPGHGAGADEVGAEGAGAPGGVGAEDDDRDPEQRLKDELDRIFVANMEASEAPWKTWKRPASREEAGPWWRPFAYLAAALAIAAVFVVLATR